MKVGRKEIVLGKKGTVLDMFFIMIIMLVFAMFILMSTFIWSEISPMFLDAFAGSTEAGNVTQQVSTSYQTFDYMFLFLFFMLNMTPVLIAVLVRHHPIFLVINIIVLLIFMYLAPLMSNVMREFWLAPEFAQFAVGGGGFVTFNTMTRVFQYLPYISMGISVILMVVMFVKDPMSGVRL